MINQIQFYRRLFLLKNQQRKSFNNCYFINNLLQQENNLSKINRGWQIFISILNGNLKDQLHKNLCLFYQDIQKIENMNIKFDGIKKIFQKLQTNFSKILILILKECLSRQALKQKIWQ
ncbi:hypothetical protein pb186bvf_000320 [Paramecium bursaria]